MNMLLLPPPLPPPPRLPPTQVAGLVPSIDKARLYRGKGGEVMREAVSRLVECSSLVGLPLSPAQRLKVCEALEENLRHPQDGIRRAAVQALHQYCRYGRVGSGTGPASVLQVPSGMVLQVQYGTAWCGTAGSCFRCSAL